MKVVIDDAVYDMTPFRRFLYDEKTYTLFLFGEGNEPVLAYEEAGVYYPAAEEIVTALLPDLAAMLDGFSPFFAESDRITMLE